MKKRPFSSGIVRVLALFLILQAPSALAERPDAGLALKKLEFDGRERSYYLHLPPNQASSGKLPVLLVLHGGGKADGDEVAMRTGYLGLADREGFIAVYPNGVDSQWNDGRGKTFRRAQDNTDVDDVGFIVAVIDRVVRDHNGDARRVYVTGLSNGGMMTLRLGCEISHKLAAIAPIIANTPKNIFNTCRPDSALPVLLMNGTQDPFVPWDGGPVSIFGKASGEVISTEETIRFWVRHNQCGPTPEIQHLPNKNLRDRSTVKVTTYAGADNGCEVILYAIEGGGHTFPGSNTPDRPRIVGRKNYDINGPEVVWEFLERQIR